MPPYTPLTPTHSAFAVLAVLLIATSSFGAAAADDTILLRRGDIVVTRADWDAELLRIPPKDRADFAENPRRNRQLLERMLTTREMAAQAREKKLDQDPLIRLRVRQEEDRILSAALLAKGEEGAAIDFELKRPAWERRAREVYEVDKARYTSPETVSITLLFFAAEKDGFDGAQKRAADALAKIKTGADIGALAASVSDDTTTRDVRGRKGPLARTDLDPSLANAVFALKNRGEVTELVRTRDGWFILRLDERRAQVQRSFDEVKGELLAEFKQSQLNAAREALFATMASGTELVVNQAAIDALRTYPTSSSGTAPARTPPK